MEKIYFIDLVDPVLFQGAGKYAATSKAREDVARILTGHYDCVYVPVVRTGHDKYFSVLRFLIRICKQLRHVPKGATLFLQYPMVNLKAFALIARLFRKYNTIALIHDLPSYRFGNIPISKEISILNNFHTIVAHSQSMKERLAKDGLKTKVKTLEVFDYLLDESQNAQKERDTIVFAGALAKSIFLKPLSFMPFSKVKFHVYGKGLIEGVIPQRLCYKGCFSPSDISSIVGDWGLLWEGESVETCEGIFGRYLTLIAPHKLSLYIACKLKVVVWEQSAMAPFVLNNKIGVTIDKLENLERVLSSLTEDELLEMERNVEIVSAKMRRGGFLLSALQGEL